MWFEGAAWFKWFKWFKMLLKFKCFKKKREPAYMADVNRIEDLDRWNKVRELSKTV